MDKTVLFIGGGYEVVKGVKHAKKLGYNVIVLDRDVNAPCCKFADDFIQGDVYDYRHALESVKSYTRRDMIDGVITLACDAPKTVAKISDYLQLRNISFETANIATNKLFMKDCFAKHRIPIPKYHSVGKFEDLEKLVTDDVVFVLKPLTNRGARGVLRIDKDIDLLWAYQYSLSYAGENKTLLLEEWINGEQISAESLIYEGKVKLCAVAHRGYERTTHLYPYIIEDGGDTPADVSKRCFMEIEQLMGKAAKAIGLKSGTLKGDLVITSDGKIVIIEVAVRLSGGNFCTINIPAVYGIDFIGASLKIATGQEVDLGTYAPEAKKYTVNRYFFPAPGKVKSIMFKKNVEKIPGVIYWKLNVKAGDVLSLVTDHTKRSGTVITIANTLQEAAKIAEEAISAVEIKYMT